MKKETRYWLEVSLIGLLIIGLAISGMYFMLKLSKFISAPAQAISREYSYYDIRSGYVTTVVNEFNNGGEYKTEEYFIYQTPTSTEQNTTIERKVIRNYYEVLIPVEF